MNWENYTSLPEIFQNQRIFDGCGISGFLNIDGKRESGKKVRDMLCILHDRENGLGAGYAGYGIYPDYKDYYAFHFLFDDEKSKENVLSHLEKMGYIILSEAIPTKIVPNLDNPPIIWRVFYEPKKLKNTSDDEQIISLVMNINANFDGAFVMSSGKNMGVFKGNGWSHEIADYYKIEDYKAYMWLAHSRFPTNTPGWWGGAHPFNLLGTSVVHNGEITSYGTNKRYLESFGYKCTLFTDTEVIAYLFDLLVRRHKLPISIASLALAPPLFNDIERMSSDFKITLKNIRATYRSAMLNGPFSIVVGQNSPKPTMIGLSDRKKLRPLVAAISNDENCIYLSSEEASFQRLMLNEEFKNEFKEIWHPKSGTAIIARLGDGLIRKGLEKPLEKIKLSIVGG
ncbi:MAG: glutamine amidotransferase family protein [Candidatus Lokiarchaeota archaeon]|nr:glutamine amidotransferase family protein [Candidatus Lokiarchaeota archaeon]